MRNKKSVLDKVKSKLRRKLKYRINFTHIAQTDCQTIGLISYHVSCGGFLLFIFRAMLSLLRGLRLQGPDRSLLPNRAIDRCFGIRQRPSHLLNRY